MPSENGAYVHGLQLKMSNLQLQPVAQWARKERLGVRDN